MTTSIFCCVSSSTTLLTSILPRAIQTAEIIAPALGGLAIEQQCELCEIHPGAGDGLTWEEFGARYRPEGLSSGNPYKAMAPGGESWAGFFERVGDALLRAAADHAGETVVVVCHGGVVEATFATLTRQPEAYHQKIARAGGRTEQSNLGEIQDRLVFKQPGLEQRLFRQLVSLEGTYFYNRYYDLIVSLGGSLSRLSSYQSDNLANSRAQGAEFIARIRPVRWISVAGS